jgi:hypothetical protein
MAPEFGKPIHQLPLIPADVLKKHCVHSRSIRGSDPPPACFRRCGAKTGPCRSGALSARMANAANSEAGFPNRRAGAAAISSRPRSPIPPGARRLSRDRRGDRRGAAGHKFALVHAAHLQFCWRPGGTHSNAPPAISASFLPAFTGSAQEGLQQPVSKVMPCRPPYRDRILDR